MNLDPYIAVSGEGGLFKLVTSKTNGLVLENLDTGKSRFFSVRKHQFTPLGTVAVYILGGTRQLTEIYDVMFEKLGETPIVSAKAEKHVIEQYIETVIPDYDEDRVPLKDMKKIVKWFAFLNDRSLLKPESKGEEEE